MVAFGYFESGSPAHCPPPSPDTGRKSSCDRRQDRCSSALQGSIQTGSHHTAVCIHEGQHGIADCGCRALCCFRGLQVRNRQERYRRRKGQRQRPRSANRLKRVETTVPLLITGLFGHNDMQRQSDRTPLRTISWPPATVCVLEAGVHCQFDLTDFKLGLSTIDYRLALPETSRPTTSASQVPQTHISQPSTAHHARLVVPSPPLLLLTLTALVPLPSLLALCPFPVSRSLFPARPPSILFLLNFSTITKAFGLCTNMLFQAKEKMQVVKDLYHSRHYAQCAKLGERLIAEAQPEVSTTENFLLFLCPSRHFAGPSHVQLAVQRTYTNMKPDASSASRLSQLLYCHLS